MAFHARSNSFPSRPHPILQEVDQHLCRLRSSEATSTSLSTSIGHKLSGLQDLYDCVDRLLLLPQTQQALAQEQNEKSSNELLDGSLTILDVCSSAKDAVLQTKECMQDLQSVIRRKWGVETGSLTSEIKNYLTSRKVVKKAIRKAMKNLKGIEDRSTFSSLNKDNAVVSKLREAEQVTLAVFESLLSFISGPNSQTSSWSLVSKIMHSKKVACEDETEANEFSQVDAALQSFIGHKISKPEKAEKQLEKLDSCIQDQEQVLEHVFRQLIKTRVSLLNILNH